VRSYPVTYSQWKALSSDVVAALWWDWLENGIPEHAGLGEGEQIVPIAADRYRDLATVLFAVRVESPFIDDVEAELFASEPEPHIRISVVNLSQDRAGRWAGLGPLPELWEGWDPFSPREPGDLGIIGRCFTYGSQGRWPSSLPPNEDLDRRPRHAFYKCTAGVHSVTIGQRYRLKELVLPAHGNFIVVAKASDRTRIAAYAAGGRLLHDDLRIVLPRMSA
jgi:hypothetical protein